MNNTTIFDDFDRVGLDDLDHTSLMNRYDTKFLFYPALLPLILEALTEHYRLLVVGDRYYQDYETLYFDNRGFKFYLDHHNGKLNRYKVRIRNYPGTGLPFIEIKFKTNRRQTLKWRDTVGRSQYGEGVLTDRDARFIDGLFKDNPGRLFPRFYVVYSRISLHHKENNEKVTIDLNLTYLKDEEVKRFDHIAVAEVKQETSARRSLFFNVMRDLHVSPVRFSKYCFGIHQFYPLLKHNRFKQRRLRIERQCRNR